MKDTFLVIRQLDRQLLATKKSGGEFLPKEGWIRTIRKALGMTIKQLAKRLGVDPSRVVKIETSEIEGAVTLHTLRSVAKQLDCIFVYSFIPQSSLETTIKNRAKKMATEQIKRTAHTMDLEAQSVDKDWLEKQKEDLIAEYLSKNWKYLWEER